MAPGLTPPHAWRTGRWLDFRPLLPLGDLVQGTTWTVASRAAQAWLTWPWAEASHWGLCWENRKSLDLVSPWIRWEPIQAYTPLSWYSVTKATCRRVFSYRVLRLILSSE